jgi:hypothetical protein
MIARVDSLMPAVAAELQLDFVSMLGGGEFGAALVRDAAGRELVLKAMKGAEWAPRFARGAGLSARLRSSDYPVPRYYGTGIAAGASWSLQERLPGEVPVVITNAHVLQLLTLVRRHADAAGREGDLLRRMKLELGDSADNLSRHEKTKPIGTQLASILDTGGKVPFRTRDIVHGDFHQRNYLAEEDRITGVFDWELAWIGDWRVDLVNLACWASWVPSQVPPETAGIIADAAQAACEAPVLSLFTAFHMMRALDFNVRVRPDFVPELVERMESTTRSWLGHRVGG